MPESNEPPVGRKAVARLFPGADLAVIDPLARIWDEVVRRIVRELMTLTKTDESDLHINVREDMALELAQVYLFLTEALIKKRTEGRDLAAINAEDERTECLGPAGAFLITETAKLYYERRWRDMVVNRWGRRSKLALEREANPPKTKLSIKPVEKNHFIPKWFLREHWARDGEISIWRRDGDGWTMRRRAFGKWGYRSNLYSDHLEAYLSLLEGDAREPIKMLLETRPLNQPQRSSLVGFLVVQVIRNPFFMDQMQAGYDEVVSSMEEGKRPTPQQFYETLYDDNEFYDTMGRPLMWSRWALVRSAEPLFVLPDRFCAHGGLMDDFRLIAPLTPNVCFVTLQAHETEKRFIPHSLEAEPRLAARMAGVLMRTAKEEFLADPAFRPEQAEDARFSEVLRDIETAVGASPA